MISKSRMMWMDENKNMAAMNETDSDDSENSTEEIPIWVRGEQRWVSGIISETTCQEVIQVLIQNEKQKGKHIGEPEEYHITERWRGVEQPLDPQARILDIWNAWSSAQEEIKISLRRIKSDKTCSRRMRRSDSATWSDRNSWKTLHPKRLATLQNEKEPSNTEELLKLVLAQGEVIRRQLKKLRHSEHQIGYLEDKTHRARVRKHGSNYLLETYLKGLPEAVNPGQEEHVTTDKNSDSGVVTEGDSEQSNNVKKSSKSENALERFSPSSEEFVQEDIKDDDSSSTMSESVLREHRDLLKKITKVNKQLLKQEECLVRLEVNLKKYEKYKSVSDDVTESLTNLRTEMTKSACEMQHNEIVLGETNELINYRKHFLENLHKDILKEEQEHEMLQALLFSAKQQRQPTNQNNFSISYNRRNYNTKELLDTLV